jgi:hypothetical protein
MQDAGGGTEDQDFSIQECHSRNFLHCCKFPKFLSGVVDNLLLDATESLGPGFSLVDWS